MTRRSPGKCTSHHSSLYLLSACIVSFTKSLHDYSCRMLMAESDISNPSKFRRLKRHATQANVSGLVKTKKPGVVVFEGEQTAIKSFLENAKGLRYLDFHHLDTKPLLINSNNKIRLADSKPGLHEVENMNELVKALDAIGEKEWFRQQMGMKSAHPPREET